MGIGREKRFKKKRFGIRRFRIMAFQNRRVEVDTLSLETPI
jgi:hypothetical protein